MIILAAQDGEGAVELLYDQEAYHLVGERKATYGETAAGSLIDGLGESVRATDDEP